MTTRRAGRSLIGLFIALLAVLTVTAARAQEPVRGARHPALSPDGRWLAFSWRGDLWRVAATGGRAERLTVHPADDRLPQWSPDGRWIAFSSKRDGNYDVFVIPADGGAPRQLTFHSAEDLVAGWTADGRNVLFTSSRDFDRGVLWAVPVAGGTEHKVTRGQTATASVSPDGRTLVLAAGGGNGWWRKGGRSVSNWSVWTRPFDRMGGATNLTSFRGRNGWPQFSSDGRSIYFLCDSTGSAELWRMNPDGSGKQAVTSLRRDGARYLSVARSAPVAAFESGAGLWTVALPAGVATDHAMLNPQEVAITAASDEQFNRIARQTFTDRASDAQLSPDGRKIAFMRSGDPSSLWVMNADGTAPVRLVQGSVQGFSWSPDGRWIAFGRNPRGGGGGGGGGNDLFVIPSAGGEAVNITNYPAQNRSAEWSRDGRRIAFISSRGPGEGNSDLYQIWLRRADDEKTREDWAEEDERAGGGRGRGGAGAAGAAGATDSTSGAAPAPGVRAAPPEVRIDFDGIQDRARRVTDGIRVQSFAMSPDGRQFALVAEVAGQSDIWVVGRDGDNPTRVTRADARPSSLCYDNDGRRIWYLTGRGTIASTDAGGAGTGGGLAFQARLTIDRAAEAVQMFEEAWRSLGERFYDPRMHGHDWNAVHATYRPLAEASYTKEALGDVILMMIGEINASDLNYTVAPDPDAVRTGELGLSFDDAYRGRGLRVAAVTPHGPTDRERSRVAAGEYLLAIAEHPITDTTNGYALLAGTVGERLAITVGPTPDGRGARTLVVRPISTQELGSLHYDEWVASNHEKVRQLSGGRIGYLHIRAMDQPSLERFKRDLWGREDDREALIIDQRYNGGGNIHEQLWTELARRAPIYFTNRVGEHRFSPRQWTRPTVVLQNGNSFSDAEIFPYGVKALGLGKTLGVNTGAGVIGTANINLIDGSVFRLPGSGVYSVAGDRNLEGWGIEPDIWVENPFEQEQLGNDAQLALAVQELMTAVGARR